jgi:GTPase SAR1 family protein
MISELEARFDRKLVVTIIGPCGSGKSTLLNALAGVDDLSALGNRRPTTRSVVVLCHDSSDAAQLKQEMAMDNVEIRASYGAAPLQNVLLIDTPDTDSTEQDKHIPMVQKAIVLSDVLICVFDAENPKRRDHVDFLAPYVRLFNGDSLVSVINKSDRQDEGELKEKILPEFMDFIATAWSQPVHTFLCISARSHLKDPQWDAAAKPRHNFDQFPTLKHMIFGTFNRPGFVIDRRMENAKHLRDFVFTESTSEAEIDLDKLKEARDNIKNTENRAVKEALSAFKANSSGQFPGVNVLLYQKLAQRWLGPVGWIIAIWARLLILGSDIVAMFRFGNPLRQLLGMASSFKDVKDSPTALSETENIKGVGSALRDYRLAILQQWPDIAESLIQCRFEPSVRKFENMLPDRNDFHRDLTAMWRNALNSALNRSSKNLSGFMLQLFLNLPTMGILGHVGWITIRNYFSDNYLSLGFFLHTCLIIVITLFLSFFVLQGCIRLFAGSERITDHALEEVQQQVEQIKHLSLNPVGQQIDVVLDLAR